MTKKLHILILEDAPADAVLIKHELRKGGLSFHSKQVDNGEDFMDELSHRPPDLILSDHGLPGFDGFTALAIARDQQPGVPFIFVSGSRNLPAVIEALKHGADAYVFKDRLSTSLVPAVRRVLREAAVLRRGETAGKDREPVARRPQTGLMKLKAVSGLLLFCTACTIHTFVWE
jgi:DNA-binding response OmpR family regulator